MVCLEAKRLPFNVSLINDRCMGCNGLLASGLGGPAMWGLTGPAGGCSMVHCASCSIWGLPFGVVRVANASCCACLTDRRNAFLLPCLLGAG